MFERLRSQKGSTTPPEDERTPAADRAPDDERAGARTATTPPPADGRAQDRSEAPTVADRPRPAAASAPAERTAVAQRERVAPEALATGDALRRARARQREEFGGINWGAAFFGWLVAVGLAVLLTGLLAAAGAAIGLTDTVSSEETLTVGGAIGLLVMIAIAYLCGGYVAGRMSRFDGARQGFGAWLLGLIVTIVLTVLAVIAGSEYNVVERANLPRVPIGDEEFASGGAIATALILVATLVAAVVGGKFGERYHHRVDRAGFTD